MSIFNGGQAVWNSKKAFQSFSKEIEHNSLYIQNIIQYLKENNMNTLAYMAVLIDQ